MHRFYRLYNILEKFTQSFWEFPVCRIMDCSNVTWICVVMDHRRLSFPCRPLRLLSRPLKWFKDVPTSKVEHQAHWRYDLEKKISFTSKCIPFDIWAKNRSITMKSWSQKHKKWPIYETNLCLWHMTYRVAPNMSQKLNCTYVNFGSFCKINGKNNFIYTYFLLLWTMYAI